MPRTVSARTPAGPKHNVVLNGVPDECPRCHYKGIPIPFDAARRSNEEASSPVEEAYQCTNHKCGGIFVGEYRVTGTKGPEHVFVRAFPVTPLPPAVNDLVAEVSPTFLKTYTQALAAENNGLDQLTGIGLRKALEFLVKDFAIHSKPDDKEAILKTTLADCIKRYLDDPNLKATAKRATWLGNDETHYLRKWEDKDISDLKVLIRLTMNWIENVLLTAKYISEMPE